MKKGQIVSMVVGEKVWSVSAKLVENTISLAKDKYKGQNAIVAVEKDGITTLLKDTYNNTEGLVKAVEGWTKGGYKCFYTTKGE